MPDKLLHLAADVPVYLLTRLTLPINEANGLAYWGRVQEPGGADADSDSRPTTAEVRKIATASVPPHGRASMWLGARMMRHLPEHGREHSNGWSFGADSTSFADRQKHIAPELSRPEKAHGSAVEHANAQLA